MAKVVGSLFRRTQALLCTHCGDSTHKPITTGHTSPSLTTPTVPSAIQRPPTAPILTSNSLSLPRRSSSSIFGRQFFGDKLPSYDQLLKNNREWVKKRNENDPEYFRWLSGGQKPPFLYIGCSDSRMALNEMVGCKPGAMFVHRNIANQVSVTDMGMLAVLSYAIEHLGVQHVIVCGHYECGGVKAAVSMETDNSLVANWVNPIKRVYIDHKSELQQISDEKERLNRLSELNVVQQVHNLCQTSALRAAFKKETYPSLHGWILDINSGLVKEMPLPVDDWIDQGYLPPKYADRYPRARAGRSSREF